jgi:hypothetical protein
MVNCIRHAVRNGCPASLIQIMKLSERPCTVELEIICLTTYKSGSLVETGLTDIALSRLFCLNGVEIASLMTNRLRRIAVFEFFGTNPYLTTPLRRRL